MNRDPRAGARSDPQQGGNDGTQRDAGHERQHDRPSVTNRAWGESHDPGDQSFGYRGQGGYGDFRTRDVDDAPVSDRARRARAADGDGERPRPDGRLREAVSDRLAQSAELDANQVLVGAEDGVVTLTGEVREPWMKACAEEVAMKVTGVRAVRNEVSVDDGSASFGPPGRAVRSDR